MRIERYVSVGSERFEAESHWHDATIRQLEIIGEATKHLSAQLHDASREIPWRRIAGMRDVLIRNYFGVDLGLVWEVAVQQVPALRRVVESPLASE